MDSHKNNSNINIKIARSEDLFDLKLCAKEFLDFINNFKNKFLNKKFFILMAYYNNILAGILVAEDKSRKVDSFEKILPTMYLHLLFVNPKFRKNNLGKKLLDSFIEFQRKNEFASINIKLPQRYKKGIDFFLKNNFHQVGKYKSKIILEFHLWNDFGIRDCQIIGDDFENTFDLE